MLIDFQTLAIFAGTSVMLALAPGPDNLFVMTEAALRGPAKGVLITLGLCTGLLVHTLAVVLGLAAVFQVSALAFNLVKIAGAAYLLYLAWQAFRAGYGAAPKGVTSQLSGAALYRRGILMNLGNPKVSVFFLAFLPQFADPGRGSLSLQLGGLGLLFMLCALAVFTLLSVAAGRLGERFGQSPRAQRLLNRLAGTLFAALALRLALVER